MRVLLAAEGESDEVVAHALLGNIFPDALIEPKKMPARGISVVKRLLPDIVRAAHFGHYDLLFVHFDLDDTLKDSHQFVRESSRWVDINATIDDVVSTLEQKGGRRDVLHRLLMAPAQSTDAWLRWAVLGGDGIKMEKKDRHELKRALYGAPPRKMVEKAAVYADRLLVQMAECQEWPRSLRDFQSHLEDLKTPFPALRKGWG